MEELVMVNHRRTKRNRRHTILVVLSLAFTATVAGDEPTQSAEDEFLHSHYAELFSRPEVIQLPLPNGNVIWFIADRDKRGGLSVHGLAELRRAKNRGIGSIPELRGAGPRAIFHALSEPNTPMPNILRRMSCASSQTHCGPNAKRPQGWAREQILTGNPPSGGGRGNGPECHEDVPSWDRFREDVEAWGYFLTFLSEDDGPQTKHDHWTPVYSLGSINSYRLRGGVGDATAFYSSVVYCHQDQGDTWDRTPTVTISRRGLSGELWPVADGELEDPGDELSYFTSDVSIGVEADYRLGITGVVGSDTFYIGATWQKPFGTLAQP
jgi:hypothetical protein